jgi:hypothetical protein
MYRISELTQLDRKLFHTNDLALLWGITNKHNLYMTITRYIDRGVIFPIYKGLYSIVPVAALDPVELGKAVIHRYTYLTTESVLAQAGIISQITYAYTFVSNISKKVTIGSVAFLFRQLKDEYLYNPVGVIKQKDVFVASPERAAADMLYFNPKYHFDVAGILDMDKVKSIQKEVGYPC